MTLLGLFLPLAVVAFLVVVATSLHRYLPPAIAARVTVCALAVVSAATLPSLWIMSMSYLAHTPIIGTGFAWCAMAIGLHQHVPATVGVVALTISSVGLVRGISVLRRDRELRVETPGPVEYVDAIEPFAVTLPGRGGRIVLSTGLLDLIDDRELDAVLAHEETHARHRHDRYLLCARVTTAALPFLAPVSRRLQFSLERWADEAAASRCHDRVLVATALAKVALHEPTPTYVLSFGGLGVVGRVEALLAPRIARPSRQLIAGLWTLTIVAGLLAIVQLHHLGTLVAALCRH